MERRDSPYRQVTSLAPATSHVLRLHLSAMPYGSESTGFATSGISKTMKEFLQGLPPTATGKLDAYLIYDEAYFDVSAAERWKSIQIDLPRLKALLDKPGPAVASAPMDALRSSDDQPFVFGKVEFALRSKPAADFPAAAHPAAVAISIWDPDTNMPLDEISFALCTGQPDCTGVRSIQFGLDGFDGLRAGMSDKTSKPEIAVHLVQLNNEELHGVLRIRGADGYLSWPLKRYADLQATMQNHLVKLTKVTDQERLKNGLGLFGDLFPSTPSSARAAGDAFVKAALPFIRGESYPKDMPVIFFRVAVPSTQPALWPLPLMAVSPGGVAEARHLGRHFRFESPLLKQNYDAGQGCMEDWMVIGPGNEGVFVSARSRLTRTAPDENFEPQPAVAGARLPIVDNMDKLLEYIWGKSQFDHPVSDRPTLLTLLSHHDRDRVYFNEASVVSSSQIRRTFKAPSVALLQGCDTGKPGASDFIAKLNESGVYAAVATIQEIDAPMAGDYFDCFIGQFDVEKKGGVPIGELHVNALRCLEQKPDKWGSKALFFALIGNSGLKVCRPSVTTQ